ncbi:hypothetical protein Tco_0286681 [Tanacetum coccineum]
MEESFGNGSSMDDKCLGVLQSTKDPIRLEYSLDQLEWDYEDMNQLVVKRECDELFWNHEGDKNDARTLDDADVVVERIVSSIDDFDSHVAIPTSLLWNIEDFHFIEEIITRPEPLFRCDPIWGCYKLADNLHDVMMETLPSLVKEKVMEQVKKEVPAQVRDQVLVYLA